MVFLDPVEGVVDEKFPNRTGSVAIDIERGAPRRLVPVGEGLRRDRVDVGALRPEMVVDDVEQHHQPPRVRGFDQRFQIVWAAVGGVRRVGQHAVISPIAATGESADRHDLDRGHAQRDEMVEPAYGGTERALGRERADVQLVEDGLRPAAALPARVAPDVGCGIDHLARPMDILRLMAGSRVRHERAIRQHEPVTRAGTRQVGDELVPALAHRSHQWGVPVECDPNLRMGRRPQTKADPAVHSKRRPKRHMMRPTGHRRSLEEGEPCYRG